MSKKKRSGDPQKRITEHVVNGKKRYQVMVSKEEIVVTEIMSKAVAAYQAMPSSWPLNYKKAGIAMIFNNILSKIRPITGGEVLALTEMFFDDYDTIKLGVEVWNNRLPDSEA